MSSDITIDKDYIISQRKDTLQRFKSTLNFDIPKSINVIKNKEKLQQITNPVLERRIISATNTDNYLKAQQFCYLVARTLILSKGVKNSQIIWVDFNNCVAATESFQQDAIILIQRIFDNNNRMIVLENFTLPDNSILPMKANKLIKKIDNYLKFNDKCICYFVSTDKDTKAMATSGYFTVPIKH